MDSFGIESPRLRTKLLGPVDIELAAGNIFLVTGSSGAGKSILLDAICGKSTHGLLLRGRIERGGKRAAELESLPSSVPLLQYFGERYGAERAFDVLCRVGLSEAMVFIKPFSMLSMGQRYRAMLADLLLSGADIWVIDEFCSNLDPVTASVISTQIRRLAKQHGIVLVAAAANVSHFVADLAPERILVVRTGGETLLMGMKEFQDGLYEKAFDSFGNVVESSPYAVLDPIIKSTFSARQNRIVVGSSKSKPTDQDLIYIGKVFESCPTTNMLGADVWLDVAFPHVIYITGTRGAARVSISEFSLKEYPNSRAIVRFNAK